ncbi:MAG TPA: hypothetical protein VGQ00_01075 [Candidatus Norongarragalinales archaeon]|jgi:ribosomal RNA assembly protein|nr:hypothetical protein [Candidatus Norongarragalinales archaeon]
MRVLQVPRERRSRLKPQVLKDLAKRADVKTMFDADQLEIENDEKPENEWVAEQVALALIHGFPPAKAWKLFNDEFYMETMDLGQIMRRKEKAITRQKGRIIGAQGLAKAKLEDLSDCAIAVDGDNVYLLGRFEDLKLAKEAITRLLEGINHNTVFAFLEKEQKKRRALL